MTPIQYGWMAGGILFVLALIINPWLCIPYALIGPGYAFLVLVAEDEKYARMRNPAFRWWFQRLTPADVTCEQIAVLCSMICFVIGVFSNSWLSVPYAIGGLVLGFLLGGLYSAIRGIVRRLHAWFGNRRY